MYTICKQFTFSASHQQSQLPPDHPCARLHGHNYMVELILRSKTLDKNGFVVDFSDLKPFKRIIDDELDHRHLNDILPGYTSAENLAEWLYQRARGFWPELVFAVRVYETPKLWAEYSE
ncbi:MAG TPA: 6-carboxytetrahydropterin synthase [Aggregatilineales bacterium]|nr:6-carboxytetrahydropterin synthase [Aggregatilineales bacterium]